jgi:hypothetical protein
MNDFLAGAIAMSSLVAGLFFLRFWKSTGDRFFFLFAVAFFVEAINRVLLSLAAPYFPLPEKIPALYLIRLAAFSLILFAIFDKNRPKRPPL